MRRQKGKERRSAEAGPGLAEAQAEFDPCTTCRIRDKGICALLLDEGRKGATPRQTHISAKAKQNIYHAVLNRLKAAGILTLEEGLLTIFDRAALGRIAERGLAKA